MRNILQFVLAWASPLLLIAPVTHCSRMGDDQFYSASSEDMVAVSPISLQWCKPLVLSLGRVLRLVSPGQLY